MQTMVSTATDHAGRVIVTDQERRNNYYLWAAFQEGLSNSSNTILDHAALVKHTPFPASILPLIPVISAMLNAFITMAIFLICLFPGIANGFPNWVMGAGK